MQLLKSFTLTCTKNPNLINKSLLIANFYGNSKPSYNKPRYNNNQNQQNKQSSYRQRQQPASTLQTTIDPTYWEGLLPKIQPQASKLVNLLLSNSSSKKQIIKNMQEYLEFRNTTFTPNVRSDLGCLAVLVALNQSTSGGNLEEYENRIVDFVTLADIQYSPFDTVMLRYLLFAIHKRMGMNLQKNIRQYYRLKLVEIALQNFNNVENKDLIQIISIVQDSLQKDKMNFITKWRFYPLVQAIQSKVMKLMQQYAETSNFNNQQQIEQIITSSFLYKFLHIIYFYNFISQQNANIFYNFLVKRDTLKKQDFHSVSGFLNSICYAPYVEITEDGNNQTTLRKKLLNHFQTKYNNSSYYRKAWTDFNIHTKKYTLQRFFEDQFHFVFKSLPFRKVDEKYLVLDKQSLKKPNIPEFVWRLFKQNEKTFLQKYILNDIIKNLYPEKISIPKQSIPSTVTRTAGFSTDNEANLKIWQALDSLGYKYKKEQNRSQRNVDLVIEEKVIIEVDGQGHYSYLTKEVAPDTSFRNLHLLLSGYKLVIISMYEYNNNRSLQQFSQLIKQKIDLALQQDVIYVC